MSKGYHQKQSKATFAKGGGDTAKVFNMLRKRIAMELQRDDLVVRGGKSSLEMAIGTFVPSEMLTKFQISDYPFIGARYVSLRDGHVYIVFGATDDGNEVVAYRLGFWASNLYSKGGMAVSVTEDAWMQSCMIMFSLTHAGFALNGSGRLVGVNMEIESRRSYPFKKARAYGVYLQRKLREYIDSKGRARHGA